MKWNNFSHCLLIHQWLPEGYSEAFTAGNTTTKEEQREKETETTWPFEAVNCDRVFVNTNEIYHRRYSCFLGPLAVLECHHKTNLVFCIQPLIQRKAKARKAISLAQWNATEVAVAYSRRGRLRCIGRNRGLVKAVYIEFDKSVSAISPVH